MAINLVKRYTILMPRMYTGKGYRVSKFDDNEYLWAAFPAYVVMPPVYTMRAAMVKIKSYINGGNHG